jgi:hypothetical protein
MNAVMTERIRLIIDTEDVVRRAVQLRKIKSGADTISDVVNGILREVLADEIAELEQHAQKQSGSPKRRKPKGEQP